LESLAQVGGIVLGSRARQEGPRSQFIGLFAGVSDFQFQRCPILGEQITLKVEVAQSLASLYRFAAEAYVGEEKIAGGQILLTFVQNPEGRPGQSPAGEK
jgi:3-hydroxymyristoyl/3-hydroxydecanoyl-(acyl carrier protein) dehydratase